MSPSTGWTLFGSGYSLFCAVFISIRSTVGPDTTCSARPVVFSTSGVCASVRFHIACTSPACSCASATWLDGTLLKITLSRYGLFGASR